MRFRKLDLNLLAALEALLEERNVSAAARRLHLSQPAISAALGRLRRYFDDELFVQTKRGMVPTPKAEELRAPVHDALMLIRSRITTPADFDPATSERRFTVSASEYIFNVLLADVIARAAVDAPSVRFEVLAPDRQTADRFQAGEIDVAIGMGAGMPPNTCRRTLFSDEHAVVSWSEGAYARAISREDYLSAGHAVAIFGPEMEPPLTEVYFRQRRIGRRIEVELPAFSMLPRAVVGTDRIATMYRHHAVRYADTLPIRVHACPVDLPLVEEAAHWHPRRDDSGLQWLIRLAVVQARTLVSGRGGLSE